MPITKSAKKAIRSSLRKKSFNDRRKRAMLDITKKLKKTFKQDKSSAVKMLSSAYQAIDKAVKGGIIKKNNGSRKKSHLAKLFK